MATPDLEELAATLATGFEALLVELGRRHQIEKALRDQLEYARNQFALTAEAAAQPEVLHTEYPESPDKVFARLSTDPATTVSVAQTVPLKDKGLEKAEIQNALTALKSIRKGLRHESRYHARVKQGIDPADLEEDFTTPGVQGGLSCPFANTQSQPYPHTPDSTIDPVAVEFHPDRISVHSNPNNTASVPKCPIRFLDQHSPEEMAQYFEKHKHEIPRSHEICVKRYQANETSIKELDRKYGNLVSMIQGLGVKHKQYLHEKGDDDDESTANSQPRQRTAEAPDTAERKPSQVAVEEWANNVPRSEPQKTASFLPRLELHADPEAEADTGYEADGEDRVGRFEKPLREIRVGESPSRPWGIPVPVGADAAAKSTASSVRGEGEMGYALNNNMDHMTPAKNTQCPFGHAAAKADSPVDIGQSPGLVVEDKQDKTVSDRAGEHYRAARHQTIFNGPIILGYAPEQAMEFLKAWKGL